MSGALIAELPRRGVVAVSGPEARPFLDNLFTSNVDEAGDGRAVFSGLLSPQGKYITWFDFEDRHWHAMSVKTRNTVNLTELVPHPLYDELHDEPSPAGSYGSAGWVENDVAFIVYDRYDVWMTNPSGFFPPSCITDGWGREHGVRQDRGGSE